MHLNEDTELVAGLFAAINQIVEDGWGEPKHRAEMIEKLPEKKQQERLRKIHPETQTDGEEGKE